MNRLDEIEARYAQKPIPLCHICGTPLVISAMEAGRLTYTCPTIGVEDLNDEAKAEHYRRSCRLGVDRSDPDVLRLVRVARAARAWHEIEVMMHGYITGNAAYDELSAAIAAFESEDS